jgi:uncharacterized protein YpiB (UPF0302 family)
MWTKNKYFSEIMIMITDELDPFDYTKDSIKRLEQYDVAYGCKILLKINRKNQIYYELHFSNKSACGIYIGAGDCRADTSNAYKNVKKCARCLCSSCINCYGDRKCVFCSLHMLDALNLVNVRDDQIVLQIVLR